MCLAATPYTLILCSLCLWTESRKHSVSELKGQEHNWIRVIEAYSLKLNVECLRIWLQEHCRPWKHSHHRFRFEQNTFHKRNLISIRHHLTFTSWFLNIPICWISVYAEREGPSSLASNSRIWRRHLWFSVKLNKFEFVAMITEHSMERRIVERCWGRLWKNYT